jgi:SAM-dependent methyltransferase
LLAAVAPALGPGRLVLELGCGTGATLALASRAHAARLVGLERAPLMLRAARARLGAANVQFVRADAGRGLPFVNARFDAVYAESVVALLDAEVVAAECARVLRPGGLLAFNERIWRPGVSQARADEINAYSLRAFGIPAATRAPLDHAGWVTVLQSAGFVDVRAEPLRAVVPRGPQPAARRQRWARRLRQLRHPATLVQTARFERAARRGGQHWAALENYLFFATKPSAEVGAGRR